MNLIKIKLLAIGLILALIPTGRAYAQFMPVVYDNIYGSGNSFLTATADFQSGDVVMSNSSEGKVLLSWLDGVGNSRFSKQFTSEEFRVVNKIISLAEDKVLILGQGKPDGKDKKRSTGRALVINIKGGTERSIHVGEDGTMITNAELLVNGNLILSGSTPNAKGGSSAFICKVSPKDKEIYSYTAGVGEICNWINVMGSRTEYLNAAFTSTSRKGSSVVRLDENGKPYFITTLPDPTFCIEKMASSLNGDIYLVGQGESMGGAVVKIRPEGDIVFQKQIIPASSASKLDKLILCPTGELLVGGHDAQNAYYALLRPDGTELSSNITYGMVAGIINNPATGDCLISLYNSQQQGQIVKLSKEGRRLYEKNTAANYTRLFVNLKGELLLAAPETGRLTMLSNLGELLFDRYVVENNQQHFADVYLPSNGEVVFAGNNSRLAKLAHGVYVSDILVNKPINGYATATFTVTLSGFSYSKEGAPVPVSVNYKTRPVSASEGVNYEPVSGTLSFIPSTDGSERYLNKFIVEVPVKANDLLEGERTFSIDLSDVRNSYLIRGNGLATIEDQPAVVKMISTAQGVEGITDVGFTVGIFKTNGVPLVNGTKADIVIDGYYANGTADKLDFDMGRMPRLVIPVNQHSGEFRVTTLEDTRYEMVKTVVVNFNKIYAMSDTNVSFQADVLSCSGQLFDQEAMVVIESLGDHTKLNNILSGFFKISLVRAKDGALLTNNSGSDIFITVSVNDTTTAKLGTDFVLANLHELRIWSDDRSSAVNLNGMVLFTPGSEEKTVSATIMDVRSGESVGKLKVSSEKNTATFNITAK